MPNTQSLRVLQHPTAGGNRINGSEKGRTSLNDLNNDLADWFRQNIGDPTDLQSRAWGKVKNGENVVIVSPTGSGKTLSAVTVPVDDILNGRSGREKTSILYVSPMKALGADLMKTLEELSGGLGRIPGKKERKRGRRRKNAPDAYLKVGIRTGDVPQSQRRRMLVDPPDIVVVTPENLLLMACSKAREILEEVRYIIIDEVHEMIASKRGALLSLTIEYLSRRVKETTGEEPLRIGLSATIRPDRLAAGYIGGVGDDGRLRDVEIIREEGRKHIDVGIRTLFNELEPDEELDDRLLGEIGSMISEEEGSMVIFHNTRRQAEEMAYSLMGRGIDGVLPHHGSLGPEVRKEAEDGLRDGRIKAIVSSTSLELGIDIGRVERVCQISSPKDPGKLLQRLGRSGHGLGRSSLGIVYPRGPMDLLECMAVARAAALGQLEKKTSQEEPVDVLAQFITGISIVEDSMDTDRFWDLVRSAYPFRRIKKGELKDLVSLLTERLSGSIQTPPRLWMSDRDGTLHPRRNTKQAFYLNCGTIPKETTFRVIEERKKRVLGNLSRDFGEALYERDVIMLGSRSYRIIGFRGNYVVVREDPDAQPTVPRWTGEVNPRPGDISEHIMDVLHNPPDSFTIKGESGTDVALDKQGRSMILALLDHMKEKGTVPERNMVPIEMISRGKDRRIFIFHLPEGRKVTEPLGRVLAYGIRKQLGAMVDYIATDDGFAVSSPTRLDVDQLISGFGGDSFRDLSLDLILGSSMFRTRFSHILGKSLLVLSRFRGKETGAIYKRNRIQSLLKAIMDQYYSPEGWEGAEGPIAGLVLLAREGLNEVMRDKVDIETAARFVEGLEEGTVVPKMSEERREPSINGRSIISTWLRQRQIKEKREESPQDTEEEGPPARDMAGEGRERNTFRDTLLGFDMGDQEKEVPDGFVRIPYRLKADNLEGIESFDIQEKELAKMRISSTFRAQRPGKVMKAVPFFSHPMDLLTRTSKRDLGSLTSAMTSGRIRPLRIMGRDRLTDTAWEKVFISLLPKGEHIPEALVKRASAGRRTSRSEIGEAGDIKGKELTDLMERLFVSGLIASYPEEARFHLGAPKGIFWTHGIEQNYPDVEVQRSSITGFLERFGPFSLEELSILFSWPSETIPEGLREAISDGDVEIGAGPKPLMARNGMENADEESSYDIWIRKSYDQGDERSFSATRTKDGKWMRTPLHHNDAGLLLCGRTPGWVEKEKVKRSITGHFIIPGPSGERGSLHLLERCDQIIAKNVEVEEYSDLEELAGSLASLLFTYLDAGYRTLKVERIMGVPAGEAAERALARFLERGMTTLDTAKGTIIAFMPEMSVGMGEKQVVQTMLGRQHLLPADHLDHPLQAVELLGGVTDRWEILSRVGSSRNRKLTDPDINRIESRFRERASSYILNVLEGTPPMHRIDWSGILSTANEDLSTMKDLSKRFTLHKGRLDQPTNCWSFMADLSRFPRNTRSSVQGLSREARELLFSLRGKTVEEWNSGIKVHSLSKKAEELINAGLAVEDPWGQYKPLHPDRTIRGSVSRGPVKGVLQRAWLLRCCDALGCFRIEDLMEYSPELAPLPKMRKMIDELCSDNLERTMNINGSGEIVYRIRGLEESSGTDGKMKKGLELTVISPRDRMWRVMSSYMRGALSRGRGFAIFSGPRPVAYLTMRKMPKSKKKVTQGDPLHSSNTMETWLIKKAWLDPRIPRREMMRSIRKRFFEFGIQVLSENEKTRIEDLYRDLDRRDEKDEKR